MRKAERQEEMGAVETVAWGKRRGRVWGMGVDGSMSRSGLLRRRGMLAWRAAGNVPKLQLMEIQAGEEYEESS